MSEKILFYSKTNSFCLELLEKLHKNRTILDTIVLIDINIHQSSIPRYITSIPSLLINDKGDINVLVDDELFEWVDSEINKLRSNISDWDPTTMSGYSDTFSSFGDNDNSQTDRSYTFMSNMDQYKINTPDAEDVGGNKIKKIKKKDGDMSGKLEMLQKQRDLDTPQRTQRQ